MTRDLAFPLGKCVFLGLATTNVYILKVFNVRILQMWKLGMWIVYFQMKVYKSKRFYSLGILSSYMLKYTSLMLIHYVQTIQEDVSFLFLQVNQNWTIRDSSVEPKVSSYLICMCPYVTHKHYTQYEPYVPHVHSHSRMFQLFEYY